jgi:hypothetical protein
LHALQWTTTDTEDPASALRVWANYSATGGAPFSPIAGLQGVPGDTTTFSWTVPSDDTVAARIEFTAVDTFGAQTVQLSPAFTIDSVAPMVTGTVPIDSQSGVPTNANAVLTFSEAMDPTATEAAISFSPATALLFNWNTPSEATISHATDFLPLTMYTVTVGASARDLSDPGNALASAFVLTFTTSSTPDTTDPVLTNVAATPSTTDEGGTVELSADVTDDVGVATVSVLVTFPDLTTANLTMTLQTGSRWNVSRAYSQVGTHAFVVWATDTSGNTASAGGSFTITAIDSTPPTVTHTPPGTVEVGVAIAIQATVTDAGTVQSVRLVYTPIGGTAELNVTMTASGSDYTFTIPAQSVVGVVRYHIYAVDSAGNERFTQEFSVTIAAGDSTPPTVTHTLHGSVEVGVAIAIHATVTDDGTVQAVRLVYTPVGGSEQNVTMTGSGSEYTATIPAQSLAGVVHYHIYAIDGAGNERFTQEYTVTIIPPPPNLALYVGLAIVILAVVAAVAYLLMRRKGKGGEEGMSPPPTGL